MSTLASSGPRTNGGRGAAPTSAYESPEVSYKGGGWIVYSTVMFVIAAFLNVIWGIAAVSDSHFFVANAQFILSGLNTWGWIVMGFGALEFLAALSIWRGGGFGRWFGIVVAGFAILAAMMSLPAYPFWSLTLVALYALIIYGLAAYGGRPELVR